MILNRKPYFNCGSGGGGSINNRRLIPPATSLNNGEAVVWDASLKKPVWGSSIGVECSIVDIQNQATTVSNTFVSPRRFWSGLSALLTTVAGKIDVSQLGIANGVAQLDATGTLVTSQIPSALVGDVKYKGTWDANTNRVTSSDPSINGQPMPTAATANNGWYFIVTTAGTTPISGINSWGLGDWIISNGASYNKVNNTDAVTSVAGKVGIVTLTADDITETSTKKWTSPTEKTAWNALVSSQWTTSGSNIYYNTGNVGVGTTNPVSKLHIASTPVASANYGTVSIGGGAFDGTTAGKFVGNANGTSLAVNEVSSFTGNLIDIQKNGISYFSMNNLGQSTFNSALTIGGNLSINGGISIGSYLVTSGGSSSLTIGGLRTFPILNGIEMGSFQTGGSSISLFTASSGTQAGVVMRANVNHSGTAGFTDLIINRTETTLGSGLQLLQDWQVGGVSMSSVTNKGIWKIPTDTKAQKSVNYGTVSIGGGAWDGVSACFFAGSSGGTSLAVNEVNTFSGNLVDLQVCGASKMFVSYAGNLQLAGTLKTAAPTGGTAQTIKFGETTAITLFSTANLTKQIRVETADGGVLYIPCSTSAE